jgi:hypothetical protein
MEPPPRLSGGLAFELWYQSRQDMRQDAEQITLNLRLAGLDLAA